jgi:hypothetical protein
VQLATSAGVLCGEGTTTVCDTIEGLYCDPTTSHCIALPGNGSPCYTVGGIFDICGLGNYCGADDVCHTKLADGQPCESDSWCQSGDCMATCRPVAQSCDSGDLF